MDKLTFIIICHFGLEKVLKSEVRKLGLELLEGSDGEVRALGSLSDIPRLNFNLRTAERVMIEVANFKAATFDELYENVKKTNIERFVPIDGQFLITKANQDKNSILHSSTSIQSIVKKAMVDRLKDKYKTLVLTEERGKYPFRVKFNKNICSLRLDTTGDSLHKRGYRIKAGLAPIEETLAAALVKLTSFNKDSALIDPFCGSGTILIEAAMIAGNIPPSIDRAFVSETWDSIEKNEWKKAHDESLSKIDKERINSKDIKIFGFDIDPNMIKIAKENAKRAGVENLIHFEACPVKEFYKLDCIKNVDSGIILSNPPYGERLNDKEAIIPIYEDLKNSYKSLIDSGKNFDMHIITSFEDAPKIIGKETKNRKLYNGMIKTYLYSYTVYNDN